MKTIIQVLGDIQQVFSFDFDYRFVFENEPTKEHIALLNILRIMKEEKAIFEKARGRGRPEYNRQAIFRSFIAKSFLRIATTGALVERLKSDGNLRKICGFIAKKVPSESVFSRVFAEFSEDEVLQKIYDSMIEEHVSDKLIGHINRDSTAIKGREKAINKKKDVKKPKRKRGRPRKGEVVEIEEKVLVKQLGQTAEEALSEINQEAAWGCKKDSNGKKSYWKGYKLHLDVNDMGIPVSALLTGANVHDSQVAIPLEKITSSKVMYLYSVMDAAYDAEPIRMYIKSKGRQEIIDYNRRSGVKKKMDPAKEQRYKIRSTVERSNSHLKDWFFGSGIYVKGHKKVMCHLLFGILSLSSIKILQHFKELELNKIAQAA